MSKKVIKVVYRCFLCPAIVRDKDAFETKYVADIQFSPITPPIPQESKVTICRDCMTKAGYLSKKVRKPKEDKRQTKMFKKDNTGIGEFNIVNPLAK